MLEGPTLSFNKAPRYGVVFLHGFGSNGADLISLAEPLKQKLPSGIAENIAFFAPNGGEKTPFGFGYQWFGDKNFTFVNHEGITTATKQLEEYLEQIVWKKHGIKPQKTILFGFSQGTMTALFASPRLKQKIGGVIGCSGRLMWAEELHDMPHHTMPILLMHGNDDDVVPVEDSVEAAETLAKQGFNVTVKTYPDLPHGINEPEIKTAAKFIATTL